VLCWLIRTKNSDVLSVLRAITLFKKKYL